MSSLDESTTNRAAPPGSMRYFSLLYTPSGKHAAVTALFVIDAEIRESALSANHDVAHTRLQWWRQEIDRLVNGRPQHPATQALVSGERNSYLKLHELLAAADMDLARMTFLNLRELRAYGARSGGVLHELIARELAPELRTDEALRAAANRIGINIRLTEILRDVRQDAYDGRIYLPMDELEKAGISTEQLRAPTSSPPVREALRRLETAISEDFAQVQNAVPAGTRANLRPLLVLAQLHQRVLRRIARRDYDVASVRVELGPLEKSWTAWRAARKAT